MAFPTKNSILDNFPLCPPAHPPPEKRKFYFYCRLAFSCFSSSSHFLIISGDSVEFRQVRGNSSFGKAQGNPVSVADCANSSPPLISQKSQGIRWQLCDFGKNLGNFWILQGNSMEFSVALNMNSVRIPRGFHSNTKFSGRFEVSGGFGRFGASKGFCTNSIPPQLAICP